MITKWKKHMLQELPGVFSGMHKKANKDSESLIDELYRQIGQLKVELAPCVRIDVIEKGRYSYHPFNSYSLPALQLN